MERGYEDIEFKDVARVRKKRKKKHYFLRFLVFLAVCAGIYLFLTSGYFDVKNVTVKGSTYYTAEEVVSMSGWKEGGNIFFSAGIGEMEANLSEDPYFREVDISRRLPGTLEIEITERTQTAAFVYGDRYVVIDDEGIVLRKSEVMPELTLLTGLTISKMDPGEAVEAEEAENLKTTLEMLKAMEDGDIFFKQIDVSKVTIKAHIYDYLIVSGTPREIMKSLESGNLQKVVSKLFDEGITRGTISAGGEGYMSFSPEIE